MSKVFNEYSSYYDRLYRDKDYRAETEYITSLFNTYGSHPVKLLLDLGCGTGSHSLHFSKSMEKIVGVDLSSKMIDIARARADAEGIRNIEFINDDMENIELSEKVDGAVCLFAVLGYLENNEKILSFLKNLSRVLKPESLFLFDVWSGPAVLSIQPSDQYKIVEDGNSRIIRFAHPELDIHKGVVEVEYKILELVDNRVVQDTVENHRIRYFFTSELRLMLEMSGFRMVEYLPFMKTENHPGIHDWNVMYIVQKQ